MAREGPAERHGQFTHSIRKTLWRHGFLAEHLIETQQRRHSCERLDTLSLLKSPSGLSIRGSGQPIPPVSATTEGGIAKIAARTHVR